jgi:lipopolysaccharide export system protein LptA
MRRALLLGMSVVASPVAAQPHVAPSPATTIATTNHASSALGAHDANAPVDVDADRIEVQDQSNRAIFSGNVHARQADMTLTAQRVTVAYSKTAAASPGAQAGTQIDRLDATGGVIVTNPTERATGDYAIYDLNRKLVTMIGHVVLTRGGNVVHGGRAVLDLNTNHATVDGSGVGGPAGVVNTGGRVTGRFTVPQHDQSDKGGTAATLAKP